MDYPGIIAGEFVGGMAGGIMAIVQLTNHRAQQFTKTQQSTKNSSSAILIYNRHY